MNLREQIRIAIGGALAEQGGSDGAADAVLAVLAKHEPVATVIKKGADRYWMSEWMSTLPDGTHPLYLAPGAQPAPSVPTALLVAVANLVAQMETVSRVGFVDTPDDKDSCAAFCVAEGTWLELMTAIESLASALEAAPEAKP